MTKDQSIGFVGIGNMDAPMAGKLARAGWPVIAFDIRRDALDAMGTGFRSRAVRVHTTGQSKMKYANVSIGKGFG